MTDIKPKNFSEVSCRDLMLYGEVSRSHVSEIAKSVVNINRFDEHTGRRLGFDDVGYSPEPVKLWISSNGGSVYHMLSLVNHIKASKTPIHSYVDGFAMSAACVIAMTAKRRFAYKYSRFMIHQISSLAWGTLEEIDQHLIEIRELDAILTDLITSHSHIKKKRLSELFRAKKNWFITAEEALEYGMIDEIL